MRFNPRWPLVSLGELTASTRPICYGVLKPGPEVPGGIPLLKIQDLAGDRISMQGVQRISPALDVEFSRSRLAGGEVLLSIQGTVGRVALVPRELAGANISRTLAVIQPDDRLSPAFLGYALRAVCAAGAFKVGGTTRASLNISTIREMGIPLPPLAEQRRIVDLLEDHLSRVDVAVKTLERAQVRLEGLGRLTRWRMFEQLTEGGLTPLLDACAIANGQTPKGVLDLVRAEREPGALPYFKVGDMNVGDGRYMDVARSYIAPQDAESLGLSVRPAGAVLLPKRGGAIATNKKRLLSEPACFDLNTMGLVPRDGLESSYLWHWLRSIDLGAIADGSNVPQINAPQIRALALPLPPLDVQRKVAKKLDLQDEAFDRTISQIGVLSRRGQQLRRALLSSAFAGRLTPSTQELETLNV